MNELLYPHLILEQQAELIKFTASLPNPHKSLLILLLSYLVGNLSQYLARYALCRLRVKQYVAHQMPLSEQNKALGHQFACNYHSSG